MGRTEVLVMVNKVVSRAANLLDAEAAKESFSLSLLAGGRKPGTVETYEGTFSPE